jgi:hypothetical protein
MLQRLVRLPRVALALAIACASCFSEAPSASESCPPRSLGCACDGEMCDEGLACEPSVALCIDPSCSPGTLLCTCVDELCLEGLDCIGGLCRSPDGDTDTPVTSAPTTDTASSQSSESDVTGGPSTLGSATETGSPPCGTLPCAECRQCVVAPGGGCRLAWNTCQDIDSCALLSACTIECAEGDESCVSTCCAERGDGMNVLYNGGVANCVEMACQDCPHDLSCAG